MNIIYRTCEQRVTFTEYKKQKDTYSESDIGKYQRCGSTEDAEKTIYRECEQLSSFKEYGNEKEPYT